MKWGHVLVLAIVFGYLLGNAAPYSKPTPAPSEPGATASGGSNEVYFPAPHVPGQYKASETTSFSGGLGLSRSDSACPRLDLQS